MIFIALSIVSSSAILLLFRSFSRHHVNTRHAIIINYGIAAIIGYAFFEIPQVWQTPWFIPSGIIGIVFYLGFRLIAKTTQESGVSAASVATKMSVIIPIAVGIGVLNESQNALKYFGITCGLLSVLLFTDFNTGVRSWLWPLLAFVVSGAIDTCLNLFQLTIVPASEFAVFISSIFGFACISGIIHHYILPKSSFTRTSLLGGILLGIANFGSLIFILKALSLPQWESSVVFPLNNVGVVALSSVLSVVFFKERLKIRQYLGLGLGFTSIYFLYISQ